MKKRKRMNNLKVEVKVEVEVGSYSFAGMRGKYLRSVTSEVV